MGPVREELSMHLSVTKEILSYLVLRGMLRVKHELWYVGSIYSMFTIKEYMMREGVGRVCLL